MGSEWRTVTVSDVAIERRGTVSGPFGSSIAKRFFVESGVPVIRGNNLSVGAAGPRFHDDDFMYLPEDKADELSSAECLPGDLVFTARGTIGQVGLVPECSRFPRYILSANQLRLRADPRIADNMYLYYWFSSPMMVAEMQSRNAGSALPNMNLGALRQLPVSLPPLPEQRAIAHILGTLDDKIENNRRMSATLEEMARALYKAWFVDFEPVRAKMAGRPSVSAPGDLADLFPDRLVPSKLEEIPEGWRVGTVGEEYTLAMGQSPPGETYNESGEGLPFYQGRVDFGFRYPSRRVYCTAPTRLAQAGDTLISVRAPVGDLNVASERCAIGRGVAAIRHNSGSRSFTYYSMETVSHRLQMFNAEGTVFGSVGRRDFEKISCLNPGAMEITLFERLCFPLDQRIELLFQETHALAQARDTLLPKLVSGDLRAVGA